MQTRTEISTTYIVGEWTNCRDYDKRAALWTSDIVYYLHKISGFKLTKALQQTTSRKVCLLYEANYGTYLTKISVQQ